MSYNTTSLLINNKELSFSQDELIIRILQISEKKNNVD